MRMRPGKEKITELLSSGETRTYEVNAEARILNLLSNFQLVEFALKIYLELCYEIIKKRVDGVIPFKRDYRTIENHAMKRLVDLFAECNTNQKLQADLFKLSNKRDELAHHSLLRTFGIQKHDHNIMAEHRSLTATENKLQQVMECLAKEIATVKAKN